MKRLLLLLLAFAAAACSGPTQDNNGEAAPLPTVQQTTTTTRAPATTRATSTTTKLKLTKGSYCKTRTQTASRVKPSTASKAVPARRPIHVGARPARKLDTPTRHCPATRTMATTTASLARTNSALPAAGRDLDAVVLDRERLLPAEHVQGKGVGEHAGHEHRGSADYREDRIAVVDGRQPERQPDRIREVELS